MAELSSGSLVKLLQEMHVGGMGNRLQGDDKPILLQIRSIIPVLREGDLWPNQGFFLRVADLSHAVYVSLPQEQDDMVLCDKLHIGQFLYVEKLEAAYPVPLLKGITSLPGRYPCIGNPKDLISLRNLEKFLGVSKLESVVADHIDVIKKPIEKTTQSLTEMKPRLTNMIKEKQREKSLDVSASSGLSSNEVSSDEAMVKIGNLSSIRDEINDLMKEEKKQSEKSQSVNESRGSSHEVIKATAEINDNLKKKQTEKFRPFGISRSGSLKEGIGRRTSSIFRHRKSDVETSLNYRNRRNDSERKHKPRYGNKDSDVESTISCSSTSSSTFKRRSWDAKEITRISEILDKHEVKPDGSISAVSTGHSSRNESSDDNSESKPEKTLSDTAAKPSSDPRKSMPTMAKTSGEVGDHRASLISSDDQIRTDIDISWDFLPSSMMKLGRDVIRQRETALLAAVEALLDASACQRLLKCLNIYSDIVSAKEDEHHPSLERFFDLENNLEQTKLIVQSLASSNPGNLHSVSEELKLAFDRKQHAITWIKAALESDLNPVSDHIKTNNLPKLSTNVPKIQTKTSHGNIPKVPMTLRKQRSNIEMLGGMIPEMENQQQDWVKGRSLPVSIELANYLDNESRTWFLRYVEDYLDWVSTKTCSSESENLVPGMMYKIKKVSDWLDMTCKDKPTLQDSEIEACKRIRNRIYEILMKHVERTTMNVAAES